jgi:hypothetical protein
MGQMFAGGKNFLWMIYFEAKWGKPFFCGYESMGHQVNPNNSYDCLMTE